MEENVNLEENTEKQESVDEVIENINEKYKKKRNKRNITIFSIISGLVLAISLVVILLSSLKVDLKPNCIENPTHISAVIDGDTKNIYPDDENYSEFYNKYLSSFKTSYLTAIFTGSLGNYDIEETSDNFYSQSSTGTGMSTALKNQLGSNYIHLYYANPQTLKTADGKDCYSKRDTTKYLLTFYDVYMPVKDKNQIDEITFYIGTYWHVKDTENYSNPRLTKITVKGNSTALYNYILDL